MQESQFVFYLCLLAILSTALFAFFFSGINYSFDDGNYVKYAQQLLSGTFVFSGAYSLNVLTAANLALSFLLFKNYALLNLFEYIGIVILTALSARELKGHWAGIVSGLIAATLPFVVQYSSRGLPEIPMGLLFALGIFLLIKAHKKSNLSLALLSGIVIGTIGAVKIGGFGIAFLTAVTVILMRQLKMGLAMLIGILLIIGIYGAIFFSFGGSLQLLSDYSQVQSSISHATLLNNFLTMWWFIGGYVGADGVWWHASIFPEIYPLGLIFFLILGATYWAYRRYEGFLLFAALLFWIFFFYLFYGSQGFSHYSPIAVQDRYFITVAPLMGILGGYAISVLYAKNRLLGIATLILYFLSNYPMYLAIWHFNALI